MIVISDSNILSSIAAANSLDLLFRLFKEEKICVPQAVVDELKEALRYDQQHVQRVFDEIESGRIEVLPLTHAGQKLTIGLPPKLHAGEREGIILCQVHGYMFLTNDNRALKYCDSAGITTMNLPLVLRRLWTQDVCSQNHVKNSVNV